MTAADQMPPFGGFTEDNLDLVRLPEAFFTEVLPMLQDLPQIRLALYLFWNLEQQTSTIRHFRDFELESDPLLIRMIGGKEALHQAMSELVNIGILLQAQSAESDPLYYFINGPQGRAALQSLADGTWQTSPADRKPIHLASQPTNIFKLYEEHIGPLTPMLAEILKADEALYPASWIEDAIRIAVTRNARNWKYVQAILERWQTEGRGNEQNRRDDPKDPGNYKKSWLGDK